MSDKDRLIKLIETLRNSGNKAIQSGDWDYAIYIGQLISAYSKHKERFA